MVINSVARGEILPYTAAYSKFGVKADQNVILDAPLDVGDLLGFIYGIGMRRKGTTASMSSVYETLESHYMRNPSIRHIYLALKCFDLKPSAAQRTLKRVGTYTDQKLLPQYLQFAINEFYINGDGDIQLDLTYSEVQILWKQVYNDYDYFYKLANDLYYFI